MTPEEMIRVVDAVDDALEARDGAILRGDPQPPAGRTCGDTLLRIGARPAACLFLHIWRHAVGWIPDETLEYEHNGEKRPVHAFVPWLAHPARVRKDIDDFMEAKRGDREYRLRPLVRMRLEQPSPAERHALIRPVVRSLLTLDPQVKARRGQLSSWLHSLKECIGGDERLRDDWFRLAYEAVEPPDVPRRKPRHSDSPLDLDDILRAARTGLLPEEDAVRMLRGSSLTDAVSRVAIRDSHSPLLSLLDAEGPFDPAEDGRDAELKAMIERAAALTGKRRDAALAVMKGAQQYYLTHSPFTEHGGGELYEALDWRDNMAIGDAFRPGSDAREAVAAVIGPDNARLAGRMWARADDWPWPRKLSVKSPAYRSGRLGWAYLMGNIGMLCGFIAALADGFALDGFLRWQIDSAPPGAREKRGDRRFGLRYPGQNAFIMPFLAVSMDEGADADAVYGKVRETLLERIRLGGGAASIEHLVGGLVRCRREDAWEWLAGLQAEGALGESQRVDILKQANMGLPGAFAAILGKSRGNSGRCWTPEYAWSYWTGVERGPADSQLWSTHGPELLRSYLTDDAAARAGLEGGPANMHFALWALSQRDVETALAACGDLLASGTREQKLAALFWLGGLNMLSLQVPPAVAVLENRDNRRDQLLMALALRCLESRRRDMHSGGLYPYHIVEKAGTHQGALELLLYATERELLRLSALLGEFAASLSGEPGRVYGGTLETYADFAFAFTKDDVLRLVTSLKR